MTVRLWKRRFLCQEHLPPDQATGRGSSLYQGKWFGRWGGNQHTELRTFVSKDSGQHQGKAFFGKSELILRKVSGNLLRELRRHPSCTAPARSWCSHHCCCVSLSLIQTRLA